ncbi:class I SAM-dependent methyltransferase [Domibacillus sp. PGB-M46]|uniref:class I SAM-dependent methyltransferase n=1 Tax=Domibacillus sp. PGB-M46 TaxID=2910255 RepID=UPI001F5A0F7E|nr:class I SAM-dependent methyltransferase [Domibacillus sp. PGB-M46]MCI2254312.1 class I SAM-dependent methyltransferase [Domibacillus sp. PGB-M46]
MTQELTVENLFGVFDESAALLSRLLSIPYLEALGETAENLFHGDVIQEELNEMDEKRLQKLYSSAQLDRYSKEAIRKAFQLAILKGMKEHVQPNHQMTPDSIGLFIAYLLRKSMGKNNSFTLLDPTIGTGNLVATVLNEFGGKVEAYGVDLDDVLLKLAYAGANLLHHPITLYNQDALEPLLIDPVDVVVCDLPVGYYPNDARASSYKLKADSGHSYAHHLFIEQSLHHTRPGGQLFFIIPNGLFESPEAKKLQAFLTEEAYIEGVIQLPETLFKNKNAAKSILMIRKKAPGVKKPKEVLLAAMPSLTDKRATASIVQKIDRWFADYQKG